MKSKKYDTNFSQGFISSFLIVAVLVMLSSMIASFACYATGKIQLSDVPYVVQKERLD